VGIFGAYVLPSADGREQGDMVTGTISVDSFVAHALFDSSTFYSFVSENFVSQAGLSVQRLGHPIMVSSANGSISSYSVCQGCSIILADEVFSANLVVISLGAFDVILGMHWLSQYRAVISCFWKIVLLQAPSGREVVFLGSSPKFTLSMLSQCFRIVGQGSREFFSPWWWRVRLLCGCKTSVWCVTLPTCFQQSFQAFHWSAMQLLKSN
jgi:hypothetical protein